MSDEEKQEEANEEQQNGEYKFKYVQLERDDVPENKTDQNIDYNINEELLANNEVNIHIEDIKKGDFSNIQIYFF